MQKNDLLDILILLLLIASLIVQSYVLLFADKDTACNTKIQKLIVENNQCKAIANACINEFSKRQGCLISHLYNLSGFP